MDSKFDIPILFLIFNRVDVAQQVFNQIKLIKPKYLFVAADGPRVNNIEDVISTKQTRDIVHQIDWDCEVKTLFRNENLGCGKSVSSAINWFFEQVDMGIILEDDCYPDLSFFPFCSEMLTRFKEDENVFLISGTNLQNGIQRGEGSYYFSNYTLTWGWASWKRAWRNFQFEVTDIDSTFNSDLLNNVFQSNIEKQFWKNKVISTIKLKQNIWDYQWVFSIWKNHGIGISPNVNLITNIGFRNTGSHKFLKDSLREPTIVSSINFPLVHPKKIINRDADYFTFKNTFSHSFSRIFRLIKENGIKSVIKYTITSVLKI